MHGTHDQMHVELQVAMNFIISYLYNKLPRTRVHLYGEELEKLLRLKFNGHWYPSNPVKGSAFRCVHFNSSEIDPSFELAAARSGLDFVNDIKNNLPAELSVWVDPGEVSYAIGSPDGKPGPVKVLFKHQPSPNEPKQQVSEPGFQPEISMAPSVPTHEPYMAFNPHAKDFLPKAPEGLFHTGDSIHHGQARVSTNGGFCYSLRPQRKLYTVDEFASTKFGSTKMKSNARNLAPFQWMNTGAQPQNYNDVFQPAVTGEQPPIDQNQFFQGQQLRPSSLTTSSSFSESSSGSSTSSSPDHIKGQHAKGNAPVSPTSPWGDTFTLPSAVYRPVDAWPMEQTSSDTPSPQDDYISFTGFNDFTPFGVDNRIPVPTSAGNMMSMAK